MTLTAEDEFSRAQYSRTFEELIQDTAHHIGKSKSAAVRPRIVSAIKNAIRRMNRRKWNFMRSIDPIRLRLDDPLYQLQGDIRTPFACTLMLEDDENVIERPIPYIDYKTYLRQYNMGTTNGRPIIYTLRSTAQNGELRIYRKPNEQYAGRLINVDYYAMIPLPVRDSDPISVPSWAEGPIYWGAVAELQLSVNQDADLHKEAAREARFALIETQGADYEQSDDLQI